MRAASRVLVARHGYAAVSMRQIASEVGLQAGALYNYTADKQSLLAELMREHMDDLLEARADVNSPAKAPLEALAEFVRFHIGFHIERPDEVFIAYMELRALAPDNFAEIEGLRRQYDNELEGILRRGAEAGVFGF